jgi:predicted DNA-binding transcriptional regulator YafY
MKQELISAINSKSVVEIEYEGDEGLAGSTRKVEPLVLGTSSSGAPVLRAYQTSGKSTSSSGTAWRLFNVDKIKRVTSTGESFASARTGYNQNGDNAMSSIDAQAKF